MYRRYSININLSERTCYIMLALTAFTGIIAATACDADDSTAALAAEVDRLQAENDALRAAARLSVAAPVDAPSQDGLAFREQGKPWHRYIPAAETQDTISQIMASCGAKPITVSTSGYDSDVGGAGSQVMSLAYSYMGSPEMRECLDVEMTKRGAVNL